MVDQIIRPSALPRRSNPVASEIAPVDNGVQVAGSTLAEIVNAGRPVASRAEAEAGVNAEKSMSPLTTKQSIASEVGVTLASKVQGDKADTAVQPSDLAVVATTGSYNDLLDTPSGVVPGDGTVTDAKVAIPSRLYNRITEIVSPKDFGAKGDLVVGNISVTAGVATATASAPLFAPSDVGKTLISERGGVSNASVTTTISAYISATQVTCSSLFTTTDSGGGFLFATDDTVALQSAFDFARSIGATVRLSGRYLTDTINTSGVMSAEGDGPQTTFLVLRDATSKISYSQPSGSPWGVPFPAAFLRNLSIRGAYAANTASAMLDVDFGYGGGPYRYAMLDNVAVGTMGLGFDCGINLFNASNYSTRDVLITGYGPIRAGSRGMKVGGDDKPIDMYNTGLKIYFCDYAFEARGQALFTDVLEGIILLGCTLIVNNHCIDFRSASPTPYLHVSNTNMNGYISDIFMENITQYHLTNNLFYSADRTPHEPTHKAVEVVNSFTGPSGYSASIIDGNIFSGANTADPGTTVVGISMNAFAGIDTGVVIGNNTFIGYDAAIALFSGSNDVTVQDSNVYVDCGEKVQNSGSNNIVAEASFAATQGHEVSNFGRHEAWGRVALVLGAGSRAAVNFDVPMKNANYVVVCTHGEAASTEVGKPLCADSLTVNGFSLYVPGGTVGASLTINYHADGR